MNKILCIGSGNSDADNRAKIYALKNHMEYRGLIDSDLDPELGCYHTSIVDMPIAMLTYVARKFDCVVLINQGAGAYDNFEDYRLTIEFVNGLKKTSKVIFLDPEQNFSSIDALEENKSLCVLPFTAVHKEGNAIAPCCLFEGGPEFKNRTDTFNFKTDKQFQAVRSRMLSGVLVPECNICTSVENMGAQSPRTVWSNEWFIKLKFNNVESVKTQESLYDIRLGNKCNLMCRMCTPSASNLIDREYAQIGLVDHTYGELNYNDFAMINFDTVKQVYVAGGEPSINRDFMNFLKTCIETKRTDFIIMINTNAAVITQEFLDLVGAMPSVKLEISVDGFDLVNQYIRWPSKWSKVTKNIQNLHKASLGKVSFNTVASIYNMGNLYNCIRYLDDCYPDALKHISYAFTPDLQQPWKFPNKEIALADLRRIHDLTCYRSQPQFRSKIQGLEKMITEFKNSENELVEFFRWNDRLDQSRKVKLIDFIPELERCRPK